MLNHKFKRYWVASLRSGHWIQMFGDYLGPDNQRCAMGVAWEVYNEMQLTQDPPSVFGIMLQTGLTTCNRNTIMILNDHHHLTFDQIADYIEEYL